MIRRNSISIAGFFETPSTIFLNISSILLHFYGVEVRFYQLKHWRGTFKDEEDSISSPLMKLTR